MYTPSSPEQRLADWLWFINEHKIGTTNQENVATILLSGQETMIRFEDVYDILSNAWLGPIVCFASCGRKYEMYESINTGDCPRVRELKPGPYRLDLYREVPVPAAYVPK